MDELALDRLIRQYDNVAANLEKLDRLWKQMRSALGSAMSNSASEDDERTYETLLLDFERVRTRIPTIHGRDLPNRLMRYSEVFRSYIDASDVGDFDMMVGVAEAVYDQETFLRQYRHALGVARRELVGKYVDELLSRARTLLEHLLRETSRRRPTAKLSGEDWSALKNTFRVLDRLLGEATARPSSWANLTRHLHFATKRDLVDIASTDFQTILSEMPALLLDEHDPLPVDLAEIGDIVAAPGDLSTVSTRLNWKALSPELFERLCQDIFARAPGWKNPRWLLKTHAPDRGRDIEVEKIDDDSLGGSSTRRTVVQCKHRPDGSVKRDELARLLPQVELLGRVDLLVIVTSGRFSDQVVEFAKQHNEKDRLPVVWLWADWDLERMLASRPDLTAQYGLRWDSATRL